MKSKVYLSLVSVLLLLNFGRAYAQGYGEMAFIRSEDEGFLEGIFSQEAQKAAESVAVPTVVMPQEPTEEIVITTPIKVKNVPTEEIKYETPVVEEEDFGASFKGDGVFNGKEIIEVSPGQLPEEIGVPAVIDVPAVEPASEGAMAPYYDFYPTKAQIKAAREPGKAWYEAGLTDARAEDIPVAEDGRIKMYRDKISECMSRYNEQLGLEQAMIYKLRVYEGAAYLTQTFEKINTCYENIGYGIIDDFYNGDETLKNKFDEEVERFYVKGADISFEPKFCGDNCSLEAMTMSQMEKFADFRVYLIKMIENRPVGQ